MLAPDRPVLRLVRAVNISPILAALPSFADQFEPINFGSTNPEKAPCYMIRLVPRVVREFVDGLELGGVTKRIVIRKLVPGQGMAPHVDRWMPGEDDWHRFQLPITSHPSIKMRWPDDGVEEHLAPGNLYEVRFDRLHEVVHPAPVDRIHVQIDQVGATV